MDTVSAKKQTGIIFTSNIFSLRVQFQFLSPSSQVSGYFCQFVDTVSAKKTNRYDFFLNIPVNVFSFNFCPINILFVSFLFDFFGARFNCVSNVVKRRSIAQRSTVII